VSGMVRSFFHQIRSATTEAAGIVYPVALKPQRSTWGSRVRSTFQRLGFTVRPTVSNLILRSISPASSTGCASAPAVKPYAKA